jgi:hypothetical protein
VLPVLAEAVVFRALFGVREHLERPVDLLEAALGRLVARVHVRVVLSRQLAVGSLDLLLRGVLLQAECLVVVL